MNTKRELQIEKGIPIPKKWERNTYTFAKMEVGDSVFIPGRRSAVGVAAVYYQKKLGFKFTQRKEGDGTRVWRTA